MIARRSTDSAVPQMLGAGAVRPRSWQQCTWGCQSLRFASGCGGGFLVRSVLGVVWGCLLETASCLGLQATQCFCKALINFM